MDDFMPKPIGKLVGQLRKDLEETAMTLLRMDNALKVAVDAKMGKRDIPQLDDKTLAQIYQILSPSSRVVWEDGKWWWYDETWGGNGPYENKVDAEEACNKYFGDRDDSERVE